MKKFSGLNDSSNLDNEDNHIIHENGHTNGELDVDVPVAEPDEHKLQSAYVLWFSHRPGSQTRNNQPYDQNLKVIGAFNTVEKFWAIYGHIIRPSEMAVHSDYHLFKYGIKPLWEDEANKAGGKWIVRLKKGLASRCWEDLILAILGEQFMVGEEICGAVVSVRFQEDIISVWNKTASDQETTIRIRDTLKRVLNLPPNTIMEYKTHNDSLSVLYNERTVYQRFSFGKDFMDVTTKKASRGTAKHNQTLKLIELCPPPTARIEDTMFQLIVLIFLFISMTILDLYFLVCVTISMRLFYIFL